MDQESITKGILSGIVDHYIREIAHDPQRSLRKLIDMAVQTSEGPTQKICYQMMQKMALNQASPYYEMIHHLVTNVKPATIKQFGINLGHNAWTFGSGNIRRIVADGETAVSWAVIIDRRTAPDRIPFEEVRELVQTGREHDIYCWLLVPSETIDEWDDYAELFRKHDDCVFGLISAPEAVSDDFLDEAADLHNLMILLNTDKPDWQIAASRLTERGFLFSACRYLADSSQAEEVISGGWLEELLPFHPLMAFTIIADSLPEETALSVKDYMWNTRLAQDYPILPVDLISDFLIISRLISHNETLYRVETDGSVSFGEGYHFVNDRKTLRQQSTD